MTLEHTLYVVKILLRHYGEHPNQDDAVIAGALTLLEGAPISTIGAPVVKERSTDGNGAVKKVPKKADAALKQQEKKPKRKSFDVGKLRSLHNGGWSAAMIADEMGVTEQTVRNHAKKEGLRFGKAKAKEAGSL